VLIDPYVSGKVRELEAELARRAPSSPAPAPMLGPLALAAGKALRRVGERLESWANPTAPESDGTRPVAARRERSEKGC
jgi:hypothetical protein